MGKILDKILGRDSKVVQVINAGETFKLVGGYEPVFTDFRGCLYESALVRSCIDSRARHASKLKAEIVGTAKPDLCARLRKRPNPWDTWSQFLYRVSTMLDCYNNVLLVPVYDANLVKIGFYPVLPQEAKLVTYKNETWIRYSFRSGREKAACKLSECAMLRKFQFKNDFFGESNKALDDTVDLMHIERQGIKEAVKSTAGYKFMAKLTNFSKIGDLEKEREAFSEATFGKEAKMKNGLLLFPNTYTDIKELTPKNFVVSAEQEELIARNVFNYFGVNLDILQNKASGDAWSAFYEGAIEPFAIQLSETLTHALFSEREVSLGSEICFTANRLQYMNFNDKLNYVTGLTDRGLLTIDEAREVFSLAPLPNGEGNRLPRRGEYHYNDEDETNSTEENTDV